MRKQVYGLVIGLLLGGGGAVLLAAQTPALPVMPITGVINWGNKGAEVKGAGAVGVLYVNTTAAATGANTDETDLLSYTLPANSLNADGKGIRITVWGTTATATSGFNVRLYFGSTVVGSRTFAFAEGGWRGDAIIIRTGASKQGAIGSLDLGGPIQSITTPAEDTTGTIVIKITGENGHVDETITADGMLIETLE